MMRRPLHLLAGLTLLGSLLGGPVQAAPNQEPAAPAAPVEEEGWGEEEDSAADPAAAGPTLLETARAAAAGDLDSWQKAREPRWPRLEWHGYMRFRAILLGDADLDTYNPVTDSGTSWIRPPLHDNLINSEGSPTFGGKMGAAKENTLGWADMRLRLAPVIHVWDRVRIGTEIDVLDNLVLGSTPDYDSDRMTPLIPLDTFSTSQVAPVAGINSYTDSVTAKSLWAEWLLCFDDRVRPDSFNLGVLKVGRFAFPWGMGIRSRGGDYDRSNPDLDTLSRLAAVDADGADWLDRVMWTGAFSGVKASLGYAFISTGLGSQQLSTWPGVPYDLDQSDDLGQFELAIYSRPDSASELEARRMKLFSGVPVVDYGLYVTFRQWRNELLGGDCCQPGDLDCSTCFDKMTLAARDGWLLTPDLWVRVDARPAPGQRFTAQAEGFVNSGSVAHAAVVGETEDYAVDVLSWGAALETLYWIDKVGFGLDFGIASGDDAEIFDTKTTGRGRFGKDGKSTLGSFSPDYRPDLLLYRYVMGGVYNTAYFKPHFRFDLLPTEENALGGTVSVLYAMTVDPKGYPGNSRNLGLELETGAFYEESDRLIATATMGFLFPFGALDRPQGFLDPTAPSATATWAWTIQTRLNFLF